MRVDACGFGLGEAGFGALADFFWFGRIDFRRRVAFVRLLSCFRLGRRVRLGINMVSVKSCGFEAFIPARAGEPLPGRHLASSHTVYPRACGGTPQPVQRTRHAYGLSPALPQIKCYRTSVAQGLLADPATKCEMAGQRRRQDPPQRIGEPVLGVRHVGPPSY